MMTQAQLSDLYCQLKCHYFNDIHELPTVEQKMGVLRSLLALLQCVNPNQYSQELRDLTDEDRLKHFIPLTLACIAPYDKLLSDEARSIVAEFRQTVCHTILVNYEDKFNLKKANNHSELPYQLQPILAEIKPYVQPDKSEKFDREIGYFLKNFDLLDITDMHEVIWQSIDGLLESYQAVQRQQLYLVDDDLILPTAYLHMPTKQDSLAQDDDVNVVILLDGVYDVEQHPARGLLGNYLQVAKRCSQRALLLDADGEPRFNLQLISIKEGQLSKKSQRLVQQADCVLFYSLGDAFTQSLNVIKLSCPILAASNTPVQATENIIRNRQQDNLDAFIRDHFDPQFIRCLQRCTPVLPANVQQHSSQPCYTSPLVAANTLFHVGVATDDFVEPLPPLPALPSMVSAQSSSERDPLSL